tara:strand:+ start:5781 stop:6533 length:753 start_codon:yes stop_codon:yes gene_type:complete
MTKYIVSLTTIPSRFNNIHITVESIINQKHRPEKIVINIPKKYNFRLKSDFVPEIKISEFKKLYTKYNVYINLIDIDYGPGTKLLGLLTTDIIRNIDENTYIILIDDDVIYKSNMIKYFDKYIRIHKKIDIASFYVYRFGNDEIGQGVDGFFIKKSLLDNFMRYYNIIKMENEIHYHDDYYISYYFNLINKKIHSIKRPYKNERLYEMLPRNSDELSELKGKYNRKGLNLICNKKLNNMKRDGKFIFLMK